MTIIEIASSGLLDQMKTEFINKNDLYLEHINFDIQEDKQFSKQYISIKVRAKQNTSLFGFENCNWIDFDKKEISGTISLKYFDCYRNELIK